MAPSAALSALESLAVTPPRALLAKDGARGGSRRLGALYQECVASGLVSSSSGTLCPEYDLDDVKRLQALFDVALSNGLACVVVDYVNEVCHDAYAVSSDAFEARLMEAEMVVQWCSEALLRSSREVCAGPPHQQVLRALADLQGSGALRSQGSKLSGLVAVLGALREKGSGGSRAQQQQQQQQKLIQQLGGGSTSTTSGGGGSSEGAALLEAGECLRQAVSVAKWCVEAGLGDAPPTGRHGSRSEWTMRCSGRAKAALGRSGSGSLFLSDLCEAAAAQQLGAKYPPASLEEFLGSLFLARGAAEEERRGGSSSPAAPSGAFKERLGALLYYLEDTGSLSAPELSEALRRGFHLSPAEVSQWRGAFLLDSCSTGGGRGGGDEEEEGARVREASGLLMGAAAPSTPFKFAEVLSRGFQEHFVALSLLRSGAGVAESGSLGLALAAMDIRLACGLLPEAYLEAGRHCGALGGAPEALEEHREALVRHLLEWAQRHKALHRVLELSLEPGEEEVLRRCLQEGIVSRGGGASGGGGAKDHLQRMLLPLYYLQRGRTPEAMLCAASVAALQDGGGDGRAAGANAVLSCTVQAGTLLPLAQRQLISSGAASAATAASSNSASGSRRRAVEVLRCGQPPAGPLGKQLDGVAVLQSTSSAAAPAGTPALLGALLQHWSLPAPHSGTGRTAASTTAAESSLPAAAAAVAAFASFSPPAAAAASASAAPASLTSGASASAPGPNSRVLFSSSSDAAAAAAALPQHQQEGGGAAAPRGAMTQDDFKSMIGLGAAAPGGGAGRAKRARTTRRPR